MLKVEQAVEIFQNKKHGKAIGIRHRKLTLLYTNTDEDDIHP